MKPRWSGYLSPSIPKHMAYYPTNNYGGTGGGGYDDNAGGRSFTGIRSITLRYSDVLESIQISYKTTAGNFDSPVHGGSTANPITVYFEEGETIVRLVGRCGTRVDQLAFITKKNNGQLNMHGPYGGVGGAPFFIDGNIVAFKGKCGVQLDSIGAYLTEPPATIYGGGGGLMFTDSIPYLNRKVLGIQDITIRHGSVIDSIQTTYRLENGDALVTDRNGGTGGTATTIVFAADEKIIGVSGRYDNNYVNQLTIKTRNAAGGEKTYGPYGSNSGTSFNITSNVTGFFGRSDDFLNAIGFYP
jgi:Jacalin-like lectin domain